MSDSTARYSFFPDTTDSTVVTCAACGCRLEGVGPAGSEAWFHFHGANGRDARGCRIACAELAHDRRGVASPAVAAA